MSKEGKPIFPAGPAIAALRNSGYKSTATAIAELIDNSIEANATDIDIIAISTTVMVNKTPSLHVVKIAVLDNGDGMPVDILENALAFGEGTRLGGKAVSLGKYGFGLKGSSISQARRVEVYSWQDMVWEGNNPKDVEVNMLSLDVDKVIETNENLLDDVIKQKLPPEVVTNFGYKIKKHPSGTLVVWSNLDQIKFKRVVALVNALNTELCRLYRFFINGVDFGDIRKISIQDVNPKNINTTTLLANDPMYLMSPNNLPGFENEVTNELIDRFTIPVKYENEEGKICDSEYEMILSIAKPEIQSLTGNNEMGRHYGKNSGITFVRSGREIGFGDYGYTSSSEPRDRWWGMEIRFGPELDRLFGVPINKQEVRNIHKIGDEYKDSLHGEELLLEDEFRIELDKLITGHISNFHKTTESRGKGKYKNKKNPVKEIVNKELGKYQATKTESKLHAQELSTEEKLTEIMSALIDDDSTLSPKDARIIAEENIDYAVDILTKEWEGSGFLGLKLVGNAAIGQINRNHPFYEKFWKKLSEEEDQRGIRALSIILMALIRAEDEMQVIMDEKNKKTLGRFREKWGYYADLLLDKAVD